MTDVLVELRAGSHLYGTATPKSDTDLKQVHCPSARDILLQRARPTLTVQRPKTLGERNNPDDIDRESFSLQRFLDLALACQPLALEMLFAPDAVLTRTPHPLWRAVQALAPKLVSRQVTPFLRYCRQQAERYGSKRQRIAAARQGLALLQAAEAARGSVTPLARMEAELAAFADTTPHAALVDLPLGDGRVVRHFDLCGRKVPIHATLKAGRELAARVMEEYSTRSLQAEQAGGVDWKAMSHAVRVGQEALELLATGRLRFPLAGAGHLLDIKLGRVPYDAVSAEIEALLGATEAAIQTSTLPDQPDRDAAEALVLQAYRQRVVAG